MKYLLDTNIYISFYDEYYPLKHFPSFWNKIENILNEKVVKCKIPDIAKEFGVKCINMLFF